jgi:hypothetical protein
MCNNRKYFPMNAERSAETSALQGPPKEPLQCVVAVRVDASGNPLGCTHTARHLFYNNARTRSI